MFFLLTYSQSLILLSADHLRHSKMKDKQDFNSDKYRESLYIILQFRNLSRFLNRPLDPMADLYQSLHSNSASKTSISPSILTMG